MRQHQGASNNNQQQQTARQQQQPQVTTGNNNRQTVVAAPPRAAAVVVPPPPPPSQQQQQQQPVSLKDQINNVKRIEQSINDMGNAGTPVFDKKLIAQRQELRSALASIMLLDLKYAADNDYYSTIWKTTFYKPIEEYRKIIRAHVRLF